MNVTIKQLRRRGVKLGDRDLGAAGDVAGVLTFASVGRHGELKVYGLEDTQVRTPLLPSLYDAYCVGVNGRYMIWRGFQRDGQADDKSAPTFLQEWSVRVEDRV
jgi:hypothetical protein